MAVPWMAEAIHAFSNHGISVTQRLIQANVAIPSLLAREVDVVEISAAPVITADLNGNADLAFIASVLNHPVLSLYVAPAIKSAADLKGKILATDRPSTPSDYAMQAALELLGVKPSDVSLRPLGGSAVELPALLSGQVQGAILSPPQSFEAASKGFTDLQDTFSIPYQNVGIVAVRSRLDELSSAIPPFLLALRDGIKAFNSQPDLAMRVLQQYTKDNNAESLKKSYDFYHTKATFEPTLQPTLEGISAMLKSLSSSIPAAKSAKPKQFVATQFLDQLPKP